MTAAVAVIERLLALPAVTALVGHRVYNTVLPQAYLLPAIRVQLISEPEFAHLRGGVQMFESRVQVDAITDTKRGSYIADAEEIDAAVMGDRAGSGLAFWRGAIGSPPLQVIAVLPAGQGKRTGFAADDVNQYRVMRDVIVWHRG